MPATPIKPSHKAIKAYYEALKSYARQDVGHESALRSAFQNLLDETGRRMGWTLIPELSETAEGKPEGKTVRPDGTFRDDYYITRGHWEAKDTDDNLETEIKRKIAKGYPLGNTIFEDTRQAFLYQNGQLAMKADISQPQALADLLTPSSPTPSRPTRVSARRSASSRSGSPTWPAGWSRRSRTPTRATPASSRPLRRFSGSAAARSTRT